MLIDLYLQGRLDLDRFVSETIDLDDVEEAFHKMERGEVLRSVVRPLARPGEVRGAASPCPPARRTSVRRGWEAR